MVCAKPTVHGTCTSKSALWCYNAAPVYRAFALEEALRVAHLWAAPPVVLRYLRTGDESIREAARAAAWPAARDAAWTAAGAAARAAAGGAAGAAARAAAEAAAWAAAVDAAWAATGTAAWTARADTGGGNAEVATRRHIRKRQNRRLAKLLTDSRRLYGQRAVP